MLKDVLRLYNNNIQEKQRSDFLTWSVGFAHESS